MNETSSTIVLVVATSLATGAASLMGFWFQHRAQMKRERVSEARDFERRTLLRIQDVLIELARSHVQPNALDMATYAPGHAGNRSPGIGKEWRDSAIVLAGELEALRTRLHDIELDEKVRAVKRSVQFVVDGAEDPVEYGEGVASMNKKALDALDLSGARLRELASLD